MPRLTDSSGAAPVAGGSAALVAASDPSSTPTQRVQAWLDAFSSALTSRDISGVCDLFEEETGIWRDLVAFTWNLKTSEGRAEISEMLRNCLANADPSEWKITEEATTGSNPEQGEWDEAWISFRTSQIQGKGIVRLRKGRCWTILTTAQELVNFPEKRGRLRPKGAQHGAVRDRVTWLDERLKEQRELGYDRQPYVLVVGGGQGGIALGARLRQLEVPTLIVEKNARPGDSWRNRYKPLCLHDPVWYDNLPYLPFPDTWPVFSPKDKIGDWLEFYTKVMELNYWASTTVGKATWDDAAQEWSVKIHREVGRDGAPEDLELRPKHLILATGMSGRANMPQIPGAETFKGDYHHSSKHPGGEPYKGKRCVILGANNSAHDIAADLWENGAAEVTIIQRSSTHIIRSDTFTDVVTGPLFSEDALDNGITNDKADLIFASFPYSIVDSIQRPGVAETKRRDAGFYAELQKRGFMLDFGDDESGLFLKYLRRGSGYYIDVGASGLVIDGEIKLRSKCSIAKVNPESVTLTDGSEIPCDLVVLATGFGSMNGWAEMLIDKQTADLVGKCWGLGSNTTKDPGPWEGELRNMWKPTHAKNLWFHGGNLHQSRHYSKYVAIQLKARYENIPTPVFGIPKVHHIA